MSEKFKQNARRIKMKVFSKSLFFIALAGLIALSSASVNAQVVVTIHQPPPGQLNLEDLWSIDLTNNTQETFTVYLCGTATEESDGLIFEGSSNMFSLPPGFMRVNLTDITIDVEYSNKKYEDIVLRTGSVSEGDYTVCIRVINAENGEELGQACIQQQVAHPSPPQLISPSDGAMVEDEFPVFTWMPPIPLPLGQEISYNLKIVEIITGQSPIDAMQSNPAWFEEDGITTTSFRYLVGARGFGSGKTYCWQVQALDSDGFSIGDNNGKSEIWSFQFGEAVLVIHEEPATLRLISPEDGEEIDTPTPRFEWKPIDTSTLITLTVTPEVSYNLMIWQLPEDLAERVMEGYTLTEGDLVDLEPYFVKEEIEETSFVYTDTADYPFVPEFAYAWQVISRLGDWILSPSEIWCFSIAKLEEVPREIKLKKEAKKALEETLGEYEGDGETTEEIRRIIVKVENAIRFEKEKRRKEALEQKLEAVKEIAELIKKGKNTKLNEAQKKIFESLKLELPEKERVKIEILKVLKEAYEAETDISTGQEIKKIMGKIITIIKLEQEKGYKWYPLGRTGEEIEQNTRKWKELIEKKKDALSEVNTLIRRGKDGNLKDAKKKIKKLIEAELPKDKDLRWLKEYIIEELEDAKKKIDGLKTKIHDACKKVEYSKEAEGKIRAAEKKAADEGKAHMNGGVITNKKSKRSKIRGIIPTLEGLKTYMEGKGRQNQKPYNIIVDLISKFDNLNQTWPAPPQAQTPEEMAKQAIINELENAKNPLKQISDELDKIAGKIKVLIKMEEEGFGPPLAHIKKKQEALNEINAILNGFDAKKAAVNEELRRIKDKIERSITAERAAIRRKAALEQDLDRQKQAIRTQINNIWDWNKKRWKKIPGITRSTQRAKLKNVIEWFIGLEELEQSLNRFRTGKETEALTAKGFVRQGAVPPRGSALDIVNKLLDQNNTKGKERTMEEVKKELKKIKAKIEKLKTAEEIIEQYEKLKKE